MVDETRDVYPWIHQAYEMARQYTAGCDTHSVMSWGELSLMESRQHKRELCSTFIQLHQTRRQDSTDYMLMLRARCAIVNDIIKTEMLSSTYNQALHRDVWMEMLEGCNTSLLRTVVREHAIGLPMLRATLLRIINEREHIQHGIEHADLSQTACIEVFAHNHVCALFMLRRIAHHLVRVNEPHLLSTQNTGCQQTFWTRYARQYEQLSALRRTYRQAHTVTLRRKRSTGVLEDDVEEFLLDDIGLYVTLSQLWAFVRRREAENSGSRELFDTDHDEDKDHDKDSDVWRSLSDQHMQLDSHSHHPYNPSVAIARLHRGGKTRHWWHFAPLYDLNDLVERVHCIYCYTNSTRKVVVELVGALVSAVRPGGAEDDDKLDSVAPTTQPIADITTESEIESYDGKFVLTTTGAVARIRMNAAAPGHVLHMEPMSAFAGRATLVEVSLLQVKLPARLPSFLAQVPQVPQSNYRNIYQVAHYKIYEVLLYKHHKTIVQIYGQRSNPKQCFSLSESEKTEIIQHVYSHGRLLHSHSTAVPTYDMPTWCCGKPAACIRNHLQTTIAEVTSTSQPASFIGCRYRCDGHCWGYGIFICEDVYLIGSFIDTQFYGYTAYRADCLLSSDKTEHTIQSDDTV